MRDVSCLLVVALVSSAACYPVSQPVYPAGQYVAAQTVQGVAYRQAEVPQSFLQQARTQYLRAQQAAIPAYEQGVRDGLQNYATHAVPQQAALQERQNAQKPGPVHHQPQYAAILAQQARDAFAAAQRKEASVNREVHAQLSPQPTQQYIAREQPQLQQQQQQLYAQPQQIVREQPLRFIARPVGVQYKVRNPQAEAQEQAEQEENDHNPNYQFGFDVKDDLYTNYQNRKEQRDGNKITGSYSVVDSDGYIRTVQYTADPKEGFKAEVTRQPTDIVVKVPKPDPQYQVAPQAQQLHHLPQPHQQQLQQYIQELPVQRGQREPKPQAANVAYRYQ